MPPRAAPHSMKTASPLGQGGTSGCFWSRTNNLVWVVDPETHPGAARPLSLRATPPTEGIFEGAS
jgi:hypothetical protein